MAIVVKEGKERFSHSQGSTIQGTYVNEDSSSLSRKCTALKSVKFISVPLSIFTTKEPRGIGKTNFTEEKTKAQGNLHLP